MSEDLKRKAYTEAIKLKSEGLEEEFIYARLEKQGFSEELSKEVAANIFIQRQVEHQQAINEKVGENNYKLILIIGGIVVFAIISWLFLPKVVIAIPVSLLVGVLISNYNAKNGKIN
jgi:F0F1-type ATP synthase assembly protein I